MFFHTKPESSVLSTFQLGLAVFLISGAEQPHGAAIHTALTWAAQVWHKG